MTPKARVQPTVVITVPAATVLDGKPCVPKYWGKTTHNFNVTAGAGHLRVEPAPQPPTSPAGSDGTPGGTNFHARWSVDDLPDPAGGFYWLGDPSSADGTIGSASGTHQWAPSSSTSGAPSWRSFFPYKPSVTAVDHYLQGGGIVHHPKGVNFNSHFIEHMWLDWGAAQRQPFTWLIAACVGSWPSTSYTHFLLDAGRNPDDVGFPRLNYAQTGTPRVINDGLDYRNVLAIRQGHVLSSARPNLAGPHHLRARSDDSFRPKMFIGVFDGATSAVGSWGPGHRHLSRGTLDNGTAQAHRYYVMGRGQNRISQNKASHLLVFEIRFWDRALSLDEIQAHYDQMSSTYQFDLYRGL